MLGGQNFVDFIKERYLTGLKQSKDVPAIKALVKKVSIQDVSDMVDQTMKCEGKKIEQDKQLKKRMKKLEKTIKMSNVKT